MSSYVLSGGDVPTFNDVSWDSVLTKEVNDGISMAESFLENTRYSDEGSESMDLESETDESSQGEQEIEYDPCSWQPFNHDGLPRGNKEEIIATNPALIPPISQDPPLAEILYRAKGDGGRRFYPIPVDGAKPWKSLDRVVFASLETWCIRLGDIVNVCLEKGMEEFAKVSELRRLDDGRYMVIYAWLYTREQVAAEFETDGVVPKRSQRHLDQKWPEDAQYKYMLSTNRTVTLWDTAISRAPQDVTGRLCHSSIYSTTPSRRWIWSVENPRFKWMRKTLHLEPSDRDCN